MTAKHDSRNRPLDWLGFPSPFTRPVRRAAAVRRPHAPPALRGFMTPYGQAQAVEPTEVRLSFDDTALYVVACCRTAAMDRIRADARRRAGPDRDGFGADTLELQIDVGQTGRCYRHIIVPPSGRWVTLNGFNNRQEQGWHPALDCRVSMDSDAWQVALTLPFEALGQTPRSGDVWGFNLLRANPSETSGYTQWAPTLGDALRPELFGELVFDGSSEDTDAVLDAWRRFADQRGQWFRRHINGLTEADALAALPVDSWRAWNDYLANRDKPLPLRWDGIAPGPDGIPESDRPATLEDANRWVDQVAGWTPDPPDHAAFAIEPLESLGDAYLLTGDRRYVEAFERAIDIHGRRVAEITATVTDPHQLAYGVNPYHDSQITRAEMLAYVYLNMRDAGLSDRTHAVMMTLIFRGGRFAAYNIRTAYTYGNHQIYESGVLAAVAALFPEIDGSDDWAAVAGRSIRHHLEREVYPDGGYFERCGYHSVALSFAMQGVATIRLNDQDHRFPELMDARTLAIMERMHEWMLRVLAPDGTMPAFGDYAAGSQLHFMQRGALIFKRPDFAWPLQHLAPALIPPGMQAQPPDFAPGPLPSHFTVMRDGWMPDSFYLVADHGPLGGQHSHVDTLGFVAYAHGRPVAIDTGIGASYSDPLYPRWYRSPRAHNIVVIDGLEPEKIADCTAWRRAATTDTVVMTSHAYTHALNMTQVRTVVFVKSVGWLIHDRLTAADDVDLADHAVDWMLHTPFDLAPESEGVLHAADQTGGLLLLAACPEQLYEPVVERKPASMPQPQARMMRLWDTNRRLPLKQLVPDIPCLTWRLRPVRGQIADLVFALIPYQGARPGMALVPDGDQRWRLVADNQIVLEYSPDDE